MRIISLITILFLYSSISEVTAQSADVTSGCAELNVQFSAPQSASYFWDFGNGATSELQNPEYSYVQPGDYTVRLYDRQGGLKVGNDLVITVYPEIDFVIEADVRSGCAPLTVNFTSQINVHPDIIVKDIVWTFGDGASASGQNVSYTYNRANLYDVSLKVITENNIKCEDPILFEEYISVEGARTAFSLDKKSSCDVPAEFILTNRTTGDTNASYRWDFGNGNSSTERGPLRVNYEEAGLYEITLTTTTPSGCVTSFARSVNVGAPVINMTIPDTVCFASETILGNETIADSFVWNFDGANVSLEDENDTILAAPVVLFNQVGNQTIELTALSENGCQTTESISVFVYRPNADFSVGPEVNCAPEFDMQLEAADGNMATYIWEPVIINGTPASRIQSDNSKLDFTYTQPARDQWYVNIEDTIISRLTVISANGCSNISQTPLFVQRPEAFFVPDFVAGCVPFEVNFSDFSTSDEPIVERAWNFGDGNGMQVGEKDTVVTHTYNTPGIHTAQLIIKNDADCIDYSREVEILVITKDTIPAEGGGMCNPSTTGPICVGDSIFFEITTNARNIDTHIENDEGRLSHCWKDQSVYHPYYYPGNYPLALIIEYYGIMIDSIPIADIEVVGSKPNISYEFADCRSDGGSNNIVEFDAGSSINADRYRWTIDNGYSSEEKSFSYTFSEVGDYMVYLETEDSSTPQCIPIKDSVMIHIRDVQADFAIPDKVCANQMIPLDASPSVDVDKKCYSGFLWNFDTHRPREVGTDTLFHSFPPGPQTVTLTVEDINGCTSSITKSITAYGMASDFDLVERTCLPSEQNLTDLSIADTTLVSWMWDFGSEESVERNPLHTFTEADLDTLYMDDTITVKLIVEDALGCQDSLSKLVTLYDIESEIFMDQGAIICQDEIITFDAQDFTQEGSYLDYFWEFEGIGTSTDKMPAIQFPNPDSVAVTLTFTEVATGCIGQLDTLIDVVATPIANFETPYDNEPYICFPEQIPFTNTTVEDRRVIYSWDFGNGSTSTLRDPVIPFDKGTYEVQLVATSIYGCRDTINQSFTLLGPEGSLEVDKTDVCPGEEIQFTMIDPIDVSSWTWDFGDGNQVDNQNPVNHSYSPSSSVTVFTPTLIIRSDETGCESVVNIPINLSSITADFIDSTGVCPGEISFFSGFENPQSLRWIIDGQEIDDTPNPSVSVDKETIEVSLVVTDSRGCEVERKRTIDIPDLDKGNIIYPNVFSPNGDQKNDFFNVKFDDTAFPSAPIISVFRVYNRWGQLIYDNEDPDNGWNGQYNGEEAPSDVYAYYIELDIEGCASKSKKGNVTIVR